MLLKSFDKYEEIRTEFHIVTHTTTITTAHPTTSGVSGLPSMTVTTSGPTPALVPVPTKVEVKGVPMPTSVPPPSDATATISMPPPTGMTTTTFSMPPPVAISTVNVAELEKRVATLELSNVELKKQLDEFKTQQAAQNQSIDAWIKYLQSQAHTHQ